MRRVPGAGALGIGAAFVLGEIGLRMVGFGHPILHDNRIAYGYRPLPDQTRRRLWGAGVHIDGFGVRGPDVAPARPPGTLRLLFLGDSVTYGGSYVDDEALFSSVAGRRVASALAGRFTAVEALNAGVNGWGPQNVQGLLEVMPTGFDSDVWVLTLLEDDLGREKTRLGEVPYFARPPHFAWEELLVLGAYRVLTAYKHPKLPEDLRHIAQQNLDACREIALRAHAAGVHILFAWHPVEPALTGARENHKHAFLDVAAAAGVPALDLTAAYRQAGAGERLYVDGMHLGTAGHAVAGRALGDRLAALLAEGEGRSASERR